MPILNLNIEVSQFRKAVAESESFAEFVFGQLQANSEPVISALQIATAIANNANNKVAAIKTLREVFNSAHLLHNLRLHYPSRIAVSDKIVSLASAKFIIETLRADDNAW